MDQADFESFIAQPNSSTGQNPQQTGANADPLPGTVSKATCRATSMLAGCCTRKTGRKPQMRHFGVYFPKKDRRSWLCRPPVYPVAPQQQKHKPQQKLHPSHPNAFKPGFQQSPSSYQGGTTFTSPVPQGRAGMQAGFQGAWSPEFPLTGR